MQVALSRSMVGGRSTGLQQLLLKENSNFEEELTGDSEPVHRPLNTARTSVGMYGILINKIQAATQQWSSKFLSYAGRIQLLNTVVFGLKNFWCAIALLPKSVLKTINKMCKTFFGNIADNDRRMVDKSWSSIYSPLAEGGFGVKELLSWNKALISKWLWLIDQPHQGLWSAWHKAYHLSSCSIWDTTIQDRFTESFRSIFIVKDDLLAATGSPTAAKTLLQDWCTRYKFTVTTSYNWFRPRSPTIHWHKAISQKVVIPRHDIISSLAYQKKLATIDKLTLKGLMIPNWCILCKKDNESHDHLFFDFSFSRVVWQELMDWNHLAGRSNTIDRSWSGACNGK
ncbi:uncharacterized protein LOC141628788 [Silene latifolia]|uniref:uncharacterized protein LOC141628788 n=1 Tax=Silene latifolia TaxID=37657 RepID=UPI003D7861CB